MSYAEICSYLFKKHGIIDFDFVRKKTNRWIIAHICMRATDKDGNIIKKKKPKRSDPWQFKDQIERFRFFWRNLGLTESQVDYLYKREEEKWQPGESG